MISDATSASTEYVLTQEQDREESWRDKAAEKSFQWAAWMTDTVCAIPENYCKIHVLKDLYPSDSEDELNLRKKGLIRSIFFNTIVAPVGGLGGLLLRKAGILLQTKPFLFTPGQGSLINKILPTTKNFSLFSWNVCCITGGYSLTDGGIVPWQESERLEKIAQKILAQNSDLHCLFETFDASSAFYLRDRLTKEGYHCFFNIGPKVKGVSSGIFIASRYEVGSAQFVPFPQDYLVGRTKNAAKGVFSFELMSEKRPFARILATHLQHSEEPQFPTGEEVEARKKAMDMILELGKESDLPTVLTGDLNFDDQEHEQSTWKNAFIKNLRPTPLYSWGGDASCVQRFGWGLFGDGLYKTVQKVWQSGGLFQREIFGLESENSKRVSGPLNLDHTMLIKRENGLNGQISSRLIDVGYDPYTFTHGALSDHLGVRSEVTLPG